MWFTSAGAIHHWREVFRCAKSSAPSVVGRSLKADIQPVSKVESVLKVLKLVTCNVVRELFEIEEDGLLGTDHLS